MHKLKKGIESFQVVDGPFAGKKFMKGQEYAVVPIGEINKFEETEKRGDGETGITKTRKDESTKKRDRKKKTILDSGSSPE